MSRWGGFARHPPPGAVRAPGHHRVPRGQAAQADPLPRPPRPQPLRGRDGEVHRLRAVRRCLPRPVHLRPGRRQPARRAGLARRALRVRLRDQLPALHPLRPLRGGLPDRGHHRDEAVRVLLHQPAATPSTPRPSCWSTTTAGPGGCPGSTGWATRTSRPAPGCGPPPPAARTPTRAGSPGRPSSASGCGRPRRRPTATDRRDAGDRRRRTPPPWSGSTAGQGEAG